MMYSAFSKLMSNFVLYSFLLQIGYTIDSLVTCTQQALNHDATTDPSALAPPVY